MRFGLPRPSSIGARMTLAALTPLALVLVLVSAGAFYLINAWILDQAQNRVRQDLNSARELLQHERDRITDLMRFTIHSPGFAEALGKGDQQSLRQELDAIRRREHLDILNLADPSGRILLRSAPEAASDAGPPLAFVPRILAGEPFAGTLVLSPAELALEGAELARQAILEVDEGRTQEARGLFLAGATPLRQGDRILGVLYGAVLLNGNLPLVDRIQGLIYGKEQFASKEIGSATIFLDEVRIATTVRLRSGQRALGTRISPQVAEAVLKKKQIWQSRARVVDDWYLTAYEPILDQSGATVGALYVGMLEAPFTLLKTRSALALAGLLGVGALIGAVLARLGARRISRPILELARSADRIAAGQTLLEMPRNGGGETGRLTQAFEAMMRSLAERDEQLRQLNQGLEQTVEERTRELRDKSAELFLAREELMRSENLAAIGALAAGVAHEINNPTAIIRGNVEILLLELDQTGADREEALEILRQTERISRITQDMLSLARTQNVVLEPVEANTVIEEVLAQVRHHEPMEQIRVDLELQKNLEPVSGDPERLRQVFTNILVNALQSMQGCGRLHVQSRSEGHYAEFIFGDSGPGISPENLEKIFNPFFTTRKRGTGLGLSVTHSLVQAMGGSIAVRSEPDQGAEFVIRLPLAQPQPPETNRG